MYKFLQEVNKAYGLDLTSYQELHKWSIENIDEFWQTAWNFVGVRHQGQLKSVRNPVSHFMQ